MKNIRPIRDGFCSISLFCFLYISLPSSGFRSRIDGSFTSENRDTPIPTISILAIRSIP